jgi:hypothetical protein
MPIAVLCPGCKAQFQVSDKFAGKKGPCPKCKTIITIPELTPEIIIHAPKPEGPTDSTGRPVFMPILREETVLSQTAMFAIAAAVVTVLLASVIIGLATRAKGGPPLILLAIGAIALAPPLGLAGYAMLRDQEAPPYRGTTLYIRIAVTSIVYVALWAVYRWIGAMWVTHPPPYELYALLYIVPVMLGIGGLAAYAAFDFEFGPAALHYGVYLALTVILSLLAGVNWLPPM